MASLRRPIMGVAASIKTETVSSLWQKHLPIYPGCDFLIFTVQKSKSGPYVLMPQQLAVIQTFVAPKVEEKFRRMLWLSSDHA